VISLSFWILTFILIISAAVTWWTGIRLAQTTETLDSRFKLGDALGGLILLGITGSLPELAVIVSAAQAGHIPIIIGTLLGGIAFQTLLIVIFDFAVDKKKPLSYLAGSPLLIIETLFAMAITVLAIFGAFIPAEKSFWNINPISVILIIAWIGSLLIINRLRRSKKYYETAIDAAPGRSHHDRRAQEHPVYANKKTWYILTIFLIASILTLIAGYFVEESGSIIANRLGLDSGLFAAIVIAFITSLPEISTGLESVFTGDNSLAIADIMGGNAFMLVLFLITDLVAQKPVLSFAKQGDVLFGLLGIILMGIYAFSFWKKPKRCYARLGLDSILALVVYLAAILFITSIFK
jgi:cation:H+ antiporter